MQNRIFVALLGLIACSWTVEAGPHPGAMRGGMDCLKINATIESVKVAGTKCSEAVKLTEEDVPKNPEGWENWDDKCFLKCFYMEMKWTDATNKINKPAVLDLICEKNTTPEAKAKITTEWNSCFDKFEKATVGADEPTSCKTYKEAHLCMLSALGKNCATVVKPE